MPTILHIESATRNCSVALSKDGEILFSRSNVESLAHSSLLGVYAQEAMNFCRNNKIRPKAVAVSCGPGSYTGLRIGVSEAKGICFGMQIPLIAIPTLQILAEKARRMIQEDALLCPMIDARRMEVYTSVFTQQLQIVQETKAEIIDEHSFQDLLRDNKIYFFGDGAKKCESVITSSNAHFLSDIHPNAESMIDPAEQKFANGEFEDLAYFEPYYLKQFLATVSTKKLF